MRQRPLALLLFSTGLMGVALSLPAQAIFIQDFENVLQSLTVLNMLVMGLCAATAIAVFKVHTSYRFLIPLTLAAVLFNNWWVGHVGFYFSSFETTLANLGFLLLYSVLLEENLYRVLRNPKLKWWHVAQRAKTEIPVSLHRMRGESLTKKSFDISESGLFLQGLEKQELERLNIGEKFNVCLHFSSAVKIRCDARVVRKAAPNGAYPAGVGLRFEGEDLRIKAALQDLSHQNNEELSKLAA